MKATTILFAFVLIAAVAHAQTTNVTGVNCTADNSLCATKNPSFCCANLVRVVNSTYTNTSQVCVNQTIANKTVEYKSNPTLGNATCIIKAAASTDNNSFLVKLSVAVASVGFLSLFL